MNVSSSVWLQKNDAGEPFWNEYHKGYDYYSMHLFLKDMNKWLKSLAIGDYKISFGQGLVISNDFSPSRNALVSQAERRTNGFRRHFSTNENDFFQGAAATVNWKNLDISLFYSYRKLDGSVDSTIVTSFKTDGLHRLVRDREKMRKVAMQTYGGNIRYATPDLCIGLTALSYSFGNYSIQPDPKPYNLFYFRGNRNLNISVDYLLKNRWIKFYGETAMSRNRAVASLNALQLTREKASGEKKARFLWPQTILGLASLGFGYYLALSVKNPIIALMTFFLAVILVMIGTYLLFNAGITVFLHLLKKKKSYYYQPNNMISVSNLIYRMKKNAVGLATIAILSTMVLVTISAATNIYVGSEMVKKIMAPHDFSVQGKGVDLEQINQKFDEFASEHHLKIKNRDLMTYANFGVKITKGAQISPSIQLMNAASLLKPSSWSLMQPAMNI